MKFRDTKKVINNIVVLELTEPPFKGLEFTLDDMRFADEENEDGSINVTFTYNIENDFLVSDEKLLQKTLGDIILIILEQQIQNNEVIYAGGTDEE